MTDTGWMVDDGTCTPCILGDCYRCTKPTESYGDNETELVCCCDEGYHIGYVDADETDPTMQELVDAARYTMNEDP